MVAAIICALISCTLGWYAAKATVYAIAFPNRPRCETVDITGMFCALFGFCATVIVGAENVGFALGAMFLTAPTVVLFLTAGYWTYRLVRFLVVSSFTWLSALKGKLQRPAPLPTVRCEKKVMQGQHLIQLWIMSRLDCKSKRLWHFEIRSSLVVGKRIVKTCNLETGPSITDEQDCLAAGLDAFQRALTP